MGQKKPLLLNLFMLLLCVSCLLLPALSRNLVALRNQEAPVVEVQHQGMISRELSAVMEEFGRMDVESKDYPISGANPRHDPTSPGRP